jgi:hypothetical protein
MLKRFLLASPALLLVLSVGCSIQPLVLTGKISRITILKENDSPGSYYFELEGDPHVFTGRIVYQPLVPLLKRGDEIRVTYWSEEVRGNTVSLYTLSKVERVATPASLPAEKEDHHSDKEGQR